MNDVAHGYIQGGLVHHQKGADSLRIRLLLMEMMMFVLQFSENMFAPVLPSIFTCGGDIETPLDVYHNLQATDQSLLPAVMTSCWFK